MKKRVIFFGDSNSFISTILFESFIGEVDNNFELVTVVNTTPKNKANKFKNIIVYLIKKAFNPFDKNVTSHRYGSYLKLIPDNITLLQCENVNDMNFINTIKTLNLDFAFVMGCPQIFKKDIIDCFDKIINYHNSYLPTYRGLEATSWAMTNNEKYTGYTFHYINESIDDGKIVFQEKMEIDYNKSSLDNELIKTKQAADSIDKVLTLVLNNFEGIEQIGEPSYFGTKQKNKLLTFESLKDIHNMQILTNIWGGVNVVLDSQILFVTKVTNNGKIKRIKWLPPKIYIIFNIIKSLLSSSRKFYPKH
jgi:methionyl-tRNA formyltransferase